MSAIPDRVWELLTDDEKEKLRAIANGWRHEPRINCPACGTTIGVKLKVVAGAVRIGDDDSPVILAASSEAHVPSVNPQIAQAERDLILGAERTGLMKAFEQAVREDKPDNVPSDIGKHFLQFIRTAAAKQVPSFALEYFKDQFDGHLTFWSAQGVMAVSVDGIIRHFVPIRYISGAVVSSIGTNKMRGRLMADERDLDIWVKGRFGYVPMSSENYLDAMRQKNIGKFGALVQ